MNIPCRNSLAEIEHQRALVDIDSSQIADYVQDAIDEIIVDCNNHIVREALNDCTEEWEDFLACFIPKQGRSQDMVTKRVMAFSDFGIKFVRRLESVLAQDEDVQSAAQEMRQLNEQEYLR